MLSKKIESALNAQINAEFWSAYLYLSMSVHFANEGLSGFAHWFRQQFNEEQQHAIKLVNYIISRGGKVSLTPIKEVEQTWKSPLHAFEDTLEHEKVVTALIDSLLTLAHQEKDYATASVLQWFVNEQIEEEETAKSYIDALNMIKEDGLGIYMMNKELGGRA